MIDHSPFTRKGSGKNAVLLIHCIAGSPGHFRELIPAIPETYSIYNILLDGHSGKAENLGRSSMKKWKAQVQAAQIVGMNDEDLIFRAYNRKGYRVLDVAKPPRKVELTVDLEKLAREQLQAPEKKG